MFGLYHLFDNGLVGLALMAVLVLFTGAVVFAVYSTFANMPQSGNNFTYVATAIAGLVLSVASGVIGSPATVQIPSPTAASPSTSGGQSNSTSLQTGSPKELRARLTSNQISDFRTLYAWTYVLEGLVCVFAFVVPTAYTHELVKSVGLTMLGFLITIVGSISNPSTIPNTTPQQMPAKIEMTE